MSTEVRFLCIAAMAAMAVSGQSNRPSPASYTFANGFGVLETLSDSGPIDQNGAFFRSLGTNGRSCATCHQASEGMSIAPPGVQARFEASQGLDPIFRLNDGANCDTADVSTVEARRRSYSLLLTRGLIRIPLDVPARAEFEVVAVDNRYGCSSTATVSVYRRPLPSAGLRFMSALMWDGRESLPGKSLRENLERQAVNATLGHAQGVTPGLTPAQIQDIVAFEMSLYSAQKENRSAGSLNASGGLGGALALSGQEFFIGINDPLGLNPAGTPFDPNAFRLFRGWSASDSPHRAAIARGEALFNTKPIRMTGVAGLNDVLKQPEMTVTCTVCHDSPNVGNHSVAAPLNIGLTEPGLAGTDGLPVITLRRRRGGELVRTTDPGVSMITGKWADVGKFKGPVLRGLAGRAPYFHNGAAATLEQAVEFYDRRFGIGLTAQEKSDLAAFLAAL